MYSDFVLSDEELKQLIAEAGEGNAPPPQSAGEDKGVSDDKK
jgi:hypothetical protein